jgi:GT2 family glycosyltransferase
MKLAIIIPVLNQFEVAKACLETIYCRSDLNLNSEFILVDNGSDTLLSDQIKQTGRVKVIRNEENVGTYPIFWQALQLTDADVIVFLHSDVAIWEMDWDGKVLHAFKNNKDLGLLGFIGSDEIDYLGGRGYGTMSNMKGKHLDGYGPGWQGSPAEYHGKRLEDLKVYDSAVVDGCVMAFRREVLETIQQREDFPIHHFYDRLLSVETLEHGFKVGTLGIAFDHFNGQTANTQQSYRDSAIQWFIKKGRPMKVPDSPDLSIYYEAESQFLSEYKDSKHFIPLHV